MADGVSKQVADLSVFARAIVASLGTYGPQVAPNVEAILFPDGAPATLTVADFVNAMGAALGRSLDDLGAKNLSLAAEIADDAEPRTTRDAAAERLKSKLLRARSLFAGAVPAEVYERLGLAGALPESHELLKQRADHVVQQIRACKLARIALDEGVTLDPAVIASGVEQAASELHDALKVVKQEERELTVAQKERDDAQVKLRGLANGVADTLEALCRLAGRSDLAESVRPTTRRRATSATDEGKTPPNAAPQPAPPTP
jgi:hypothetical protein